MPVLSICFDNYEMTRSYLEGWLTRVSRYKPSANIRLAIASRTRLSPVWEQLRGATAVIPVNVFTEAEAEEFLDTHGVTNPERRVEILEFSGRLPILMVWLAAPGGNIADTGIPTADIVDRFLRWVTDPQQRQAALYASVPRYFNLDILVVLFDNKEIDMEPIFEWLRTMPFVIEREHGWEYHDVVRRHFLHYYRHTGEKIYRALHARLAEYYGEERKKLDLEEAERWVNERWRRFSLEYAYHYLLAAPERHWTAIVDLFTIALRERRAFAREMVDVLALPSTRDELDDRQEQMIKLLRKSLQAIKDGSLAHGLDMLNYLCEFEDLSRQARVYAFAYRGEAYRLEEQYSKALADFKLAIELDEKYTWAIAHRGNTYRLMGEYERALADLNQAIELDEKYAWATGQRGYTYQLMGKYDKALADFDRAIELDKTVTWAIAHRGYTYQLMEKYDKALADLRQALQLDDDYHWAHERLAMLLGDIGEPDEALEEYDRAIATSEGTCHACYENKGRLLRELGRLDESLEMLDKAISISSGCSLAYANRGDTYRLMKKYDKALLDFDRATQLDASNVLAIASRGATYRLMGEYDRALANLDQAIQLDETNAFAIAERGGTYRLMKEYDKALADLDRAIQLDETDAFAIANRGATYRLMGEYDKALADLDQAIQLDESHHWAYEQKGITLQSLGRYREAIAALIKAVETDEDCPSCRNSRGLVRSYMGDYQGAIQDYQKALELEPDSAHYALYNIAVATARLKGVANATEEIACAKAALEPILQTSDRSSGLYGLGGLAAIAGDVEKALDYLAQATQLGPEPKEWARQDVAWLDLRDHPQFQELIGSGD